MSSFMSRERLRELLLTHSVRHGQFVLASGATSDLFVDCKQTVLLAEGHALVGELLFERVRALVPRPRYVAGVELGGCPLASAVALTSFRVGDPVDAIYVRKQAKDHGSRRALEGDGSAAEGAAVAVVEDVITTGGSTLRAVDQLRRRGLSVVGVAAIVDRNEGGKAALAEAGLPLVAIFDRADLAAPASVETGDR